MSSIKCNECGLVNFATEANCKRCGKPLPNSSSAVPASAPVTPALRTEDGYVLPPPPSVGFYPSTIGVWRDRSTLVMSKGASLPDRCVKCNEPAQGLRLKRKLSWHHPALYILIFVALLIYLIVGSIMAEDGTYALIGFLLLIAGIIYGIVVARVVAPAKIDDRFVWLKGVNKDYLNALPAWPV